MASVASAAGKEGLKRGARRDPELYVLMGLMVSAFSFVGWYWGSKPTSATSEEKVTIADKGVPWKEKGVENTDKDNFMYKYHPNLDYRNPPVRAPSALHSVVIPNVTLPKHLHEKFNKWGKDNY